MVGYLLLLLLSSSFASEFENLQKNTDWPSICENHPQAIKAVSSKFSEDQGGWCNLTFPFASTAEERTTLCSDLYMDSLESTSGDEFTTTCNYKRLTRCEIGYSLINGLCYKLNDTKSTFKEAEKKCDSVGAWIAGYESEQDLKYLMNYANPVKYGIDAKSVWISSSEQMVFRRSVEAPALPGTVVNAFEKTSSFYCVKNVLRSRTGYEKMCNIIKNTFKLTAHYESGNCFMLSPSVSIDHSLNTDHSVKSREKSFEEFHSECRWISDQDYAVSPVTDTRKKGMMAVVKQLFEEEEIIVPGFKAEGRWYIMNKNIQEGIVKPEELNEQGSFIFAPSEPKDKGDDTGSTGLIMGTSADRYKLKTIPGYVRRHRICVSGVSINEMPRTSCNDKNSKNPHLREGWKSLLRDDGKVMCAKAMIADFNEKKPNDIVWYDCRNYETMKSVCAAADAVLTPIQSAEEQSLIAGLLAERMKEVQIFTSKHYIENKANARGQGKSVVWLGATKQEPLTGVREGARFAWDYDGKDLGYKNFANNEPNNVDNEERCLQMYTSSNLQFQWNDIKCSNGCTYIDQLIGAVCARFIEE